jgi:hypothetical protein
LADTELKLENKEKEINMYKLNFGQNHEGSFVETLKIEVTERAREVKIFG